MKIAVITLYLPSETKMGVGYQAHAMANALVSRGHSVTIFSPCAKPADARYDLQNVPVGNSLRTFRFAWNLRKTDFSGFDVIHAHGDNYWLWSRRHRPPVVRTMHGSCLVEARNVPGVKEKLRMAMLYLAELLAVVVADKTVAVSADTLRYYPGLRTVIPNGVDVAAFAAPAADSMRRPSADSLNETPASPCLMSHPGEPGFNESDASASLINNELPETLNEARRSASLRPPQVPARRDLIKEAAGRRLIKGEAAGPSPGSLSGAERSVSLRKESRPAILFVGTFSNRKRGKLLMEVFARDILPALPAAQLWMVCSDAPAAPGVTVLGRLSQDELGDRYRRAWVFCLPSTYEGFGIPYIEAMAAGTPVVATPNVGVLEVTRNGQDGLVVPDDQLGQTLLKVLTDDALREKLQTAGLKRVQDFEINTVCEKYEKIYTALTTRSTINDHRTTNDDGVHHNDTTTQRTNDG